MTGRPTICRRIPQTRSGLRWPWAVPTGPHFSRLLQVQRDAVARHFRDIVFRGTNSAGASEDDERELPGGASRPAVGPRRNSARVWLEDAAPDVQLQRLAGRGVPVRRRKCSSGCAACGRAACSSASTCPAASGSMRWCPRCSARRAGRPRWPGPSTAWCWCSSPSGAGQPTLPCSMRIRRRSSGW